MLLVGFRFVEYDGCLRGEAEFPYSLVMPHLSIESLPILRGEEKERCVCIYMTLRDTKGLNGRSRVVVNNNKTAGPVSSNCKWKEKY